MKQKTIGNETRVNRWGYFFVLPFVIVYFAFQFYPTLYTLALAFTDSKGFTVLSGNYNFVGGKTFSDLLRTSISGEQLRIHLSCGDGTAPQLGVALILSIWLSDSRLKLKGRGFFRAIIYMPNLLTTASVALLFRSLFGYPLGPVNQFLQSLGFFAEVTREDGSVVQEAFNFFRYVSASRGIVAFIQWWMWYGHTVIMLMAGITSINESLFESALVDGANSRQTTWYITLPLLAP